MKVSIQTKLLALCISLVFLAIAGISLTYYVMTKQDKQRELQQRIQIAFDIILDDFVNRISTYQAKVADFLQKDLTLGLTTSTYNQDETQLGTAAFIAFVERSAQELKKFGDVVLVDQLTLYALNKRLLVAYQHIDGRGTVGAYTKSVDGKDSYLQLADSTQSLASMWLAGTSPDAPLPSSLNAAYEGEIPKTIQTQPFRRNQQFGIRVIAPIYRKDLLTGILVGEFLYTQNILARYAALSQTAVNLFVGNQLSMGTLSEQTTLNSNAIDQIETCEALWHNKQPVRIFPATLGTHQYYQGQCTFRDGTETVGVINVSLSQDIEKRAIQKILISVLVVSSAAIVIASGILTIASRKSLHALARLLAAANAIAAGDFHQEIQIQQQDEIGALASAFREMQATIARVFQDLRSLIQGVQEGHWETRGQVEAYAGGWRELVEGINQALEAFVAPMTQINHTLESVSCGDFTETLTDHYQGDFRTMMVQLQQMMTRLTDVVIHVKTAAQDVAQRSQEMNAAAEQMSEGAAEQAAATEEVSASMEEMTANIRQTADNARLTEGIAIKSAEDAHAGQHAVTEIIHAMEVIAERISVVQEIAGQTNILSLNATIEAAKAQDYGKGFSVVASSVRELARQSRTAADEIRTLVHSCVVLSAQAGDILQRLVPNSEKTAELVQEISAASQEQSTGVEHVNQAVQQLDSVTQHTAATAEEVAVTAENLTHQADTLQKTMAFFTINEAQPVSQAQEDDVLRLLQGISKDRLAALLTAALSGQPQAAETTIANPPPQTQKPSGPRTPFHGGVIHLNTPHAAGDERDQEFERY